MSFMTVVKYCVLACFTVLKIEKCQGLYVVEILLERWENPLHGEHNDLCCQSERAYVPNCETSCQTIFHFCLQPSSKLFAENCPFGFYEHYSINREDGDNITFDQIGGNDLGHVPNPFSTAIPEPLTKGAALNVIAINDLDHSKELISVHRILFDSLTSNSSVRIEQTSNLGRSTLTLSFKVSCYPGFKGDDCIELCTEDDYNNNTTSTSFSDGSLSKFNSTSVIATSNNSNETLPYNKNDYHYEVPINNYGIDNNDTVDFNDSFSYVSTLGFLAALCLVTLLLLITCSVLAMTIVLLRCRTKRNKSTDNSKSSISRGTEIQQGDVIYSQIPYKEEQEVTPRPPSLIINSNLAYTSRKALTITTSNNPAYIISMTSNA